MAPFLLVSVALHMLCFQLSQPHLSRPQPFRDAATAALVLRLRPPEPIAAPRRDESAVSRPRPLPQRAPGRQLPATPAAAPPSMAGPSALVPGAPVEPAPGDTTAVSPPAVGDMLASARREAANIAREMNRSSRRSAEFRSKTQENLDRQFDAAHAAGGAWFRSARVEEITTAGDGNARVYRIVTPFGAFCRTYPANGGQPMNTNCPH